MFFCVLCLSFSVEETFKLFSHFPPPPDDPHLQLLRAAVVSLAVFVGKIKTLFRDDSKLSTSLFFFHFSIFMLILSSKNCLQSDFLSRVCSLLVQENAGLVVPWLIGLLTFISFEALGLVYANVLKDQIFGVSVQRFMEIETEAGMSLSSRASTLIINSHQFHFYVTLSHLSSLRSILIISVEQNWCFSSPGSYLM